MANHFVKDLSLATPADVQRQLAAAVRDRRKNRQLSRAALARLSTVPAATIKRFETSGEISLRQFILLWRTVDDLSGLAALAAEHPAMPRSIEEVLRR